MHYGYIRPGGLCLNIGRTYSITHYISYLMIYRILQDVAQKSGLSKGRLIPGTCEI